MQAALPQVQPLSGGELDEIEQQRSEHPGIARVLLGKFEDALALAEHVFRHGSVREHAHQTRDDLLDELRR